MHLSICADRMSLLDTGDTVPNGNADPVRHYRSLIARDIYKKFCSHTLVYFNISLWGECRHKGIRKAKETGGGLIWL